MKYDRFHSMILGLATFLVMTAGTACVEPIVPVDIGKDGAAELTLRINAPSAGLITATPCSRPFIGLSTMARMVTSRRCPSRAV